MPRLVKTRKEQNLIDRIEEEELYKAKMAAEYPSALMSILERATSGENNFELKVLFNRFYLVDRDSRQDFNLPLVYDTDYADEFASLQHFLNMAQAARVEQERKYNLRETALAKLTTEEREVLGL